MSDAEAYEAMLEILLSTNTDALRDMVKVARSANMDRDTFRRYFMELSISADMSRRHVFPEMVYQSILGMSTL